MSDCGLGFSGLTLADLRQSINYPYSSLNLFTCLNCAMTLAERIREAMGDKSPADIARAT